MSTPSSAPKSLDAIASKLLRNQEMKQKLAIAADDVRTDAPNGSVDSSCNTGPQILSMVRLYLDMVRMLSLKFILYLALNNCRQ